MLHDALSGRHGRFELGRTAEVDLYIYMCAEHGRKADAPRTEPWEDKDYGGGLSFICCVRPA